MGMGHGAWGIASTPSIRSFPSIPSNRFRSLGTGNKNNNNNKNSGEHNNLFIISIIFLSELFDALLSGMRREESTWVVGLKWMLAKKKVKYPKSA